VDKSKAVKEADVNVSSVGCPGGCPKHQCRHHFPEVEINSGVPVPPPPINKGVLQELNVRIPWEEIQAGQSFFLLGASKKAQSAIHTQASRRKIKVRTEFRVEAEGRGLRVWLNDQTA